MGTRIVIKKRAYLFTIRFLALFLALSQHGYSSIESFAENANQEIFARHDLLHSSAGKDIVVVLGNTGAGKSTLINHLAGKPLQMGEHGDIILGNDNDTSAMLIGLGGDSETLYPRSIDIQGITLYDMPGFEDTRGAPAHFISAVFTKHILERAATIRLVLVMGKDEITAGHGKMLKSLLETVKIMLGESYETICQHSSLFVVTKSTNESIETTKDYLFAKCAPQYLTSLKVWTENEKFFHMRCPLDDGSISLEERTQILSKLHDLKGQPCTEVNIKPLYAYDTQDALRAFYSYVLKKELSQVFKKQISTPSEVRSAIAQCSNNHTFWQDLKSKASQLPAMLLLIPLSDKIFHEAIETFQANNSQILDMYRTSLGGMEVQLAKEFGDRCVSLMEQVQRQYITLLKDQSALDKSMPASLSEAQNSLAQLRDVSTANFINVVEDLINQDSAVNSLINNLPETSAEKEIFKKSLKDFMEQSCPKHIQAYQSAIHHKKEALELYIIQEQEKIQLEQQRKQQHEAEQRRQEEIRRRKQAEAASNAVRKEIFEDLVRSVDIEISRSIMLGMDREDKLSVINNVYTERIIEQLRQGIRNRGGFAAEPRFREIEIPDFSQGLRGGIMSDMARHQTFGTDRPFTQNPYGFSPFRF